MHGPLTVDLMPICTPRMNTLSSRKQGGDLEEIDHRGRRIASRIRIGLYKHGLYTSDCVHLQRYFETLDGEGPLVGPVTISHHA